jgi:hypothetical protein
MKVLLRILTEIRSVHARRVAYELAGPPHRLLAIVTLPSAHSPNFLVVCRTVVDSVRVMIDIMSIDCKIRRQIFASEVCCNAHALERILGHLVICKVCDHHLSGL